MSDYLLDQTAEPEIPPPSPETELHEILYRWTCPACRSHEKPREVPAVDPMDDDPSWTCRACGFETWESEDFEA